MSARGHAAARRLAIRRLLRSQVVTSQEELQALLLAAGHTVTQSTVSRDLAAIGAVKEGGDAGDRYVVGRPAAQGAELAALERALSELVLGLRSSGNLVVVRTVPGAAQAVAGFLDRAGVDGVLGTVAGDDTILVVGEERGGAKLARRLEQLAG